MACPVIVVSYREEYSEMAFSEEFASSSLEAFVKIPLPISDA